MSKKNISKQMSLLSSDGQEPARVPATPLMKVVAMKAPKNKSMKKVFTAEEIAEITTNAATKTNKDNDNLTNREKYRIIKRKIKEMEKGNQSRVIVFPSVSSGIVWYKLIDFSALYYVYRLADRMGRSAHIYKDSDKFSKALYSASFQNIDKFIEQFERLEHPRLDVTEDGVYIFTLERPLTDDEVGMLRRTEETRREKLHNVLKPKAMDPATFQAILMVVRQVAPRVRKLERQYYYTTGEGMIKDIQQLLAVYFDFADGVLEKKEAGEKLIRIVHRLLAGVTILSETRIWQYDVSAAIGENINEIKRLVTKDFGIK